MRRLFIPSLIFMGSLAGALLHAQISPNLQACKTDVLDVYMGKGSAKPEVITLIDQSGSTRRLAWDARYYTNVACNWHITCAYRGNNSTSSYRVFNTTSLNEFNDNVEGDFLVTSSSTYPNIKYTVKYGSPSDTRMAEGLLIKPNGDPVTTGDGLSSSTANAEDWVRQASHVRFALTSFPYSVSPTYTYKLSNGNSQSYRVPSLNCNIRVRTLSGSGDYQTNPLENIADYTTGDPTRVVDIPLPWAVFDRVPWNESLAANHRNLSPAPGGYNTALEENHPQHMYLYDPVHSNTIGAPIPTSAAQHYEIDANWWKPTGSGGLGNDLLGSNGDFKGFALNPDYIAWCFFGQDIRNQDEAGSLQNNMVDNYGRYVIPDARDREGAAGFLFHPAGSNKDTATRAGNGLPNMTRLQALKYAVIKTWIKEQNNVWWAVRFLKLGTSGFQENGRGASSSSHYNSANLVGEDGNARKLRLIKKPASSNTPDKTIDEIQTMGSSGSTPLTFSLLNTYAQMASQDKGNGIFEEASTSERPMPACRNSFVIVLSDGKPNDDKDDADGQDGQALGDGDPFYNGKFDNGGVPLFNYSTLRPEKENFNIWTLAGVAARSPIVPTTVKPGEPTPQSRTYWPKDNSKNSNVEPPFAIATRTDASIRRISTITIGVSMSGKRTDADGAKMAMYKTALYGWAKREYFTSANLPLPYDANKPDRSNKALNPFFFDAQSPDAIADALSTAIDGTKQVTNTMSAPVAPLVGIGLGDQMYLGTFRTSNDSHIWKGDLFTVGMRTNKDKKVVMIKSNGSELESGEGINAETALWAASTMFQEKTWQARKLKTFKPVPPSDTPLTAPIDLDVWDTPGGVSGELSTTKYPNSYLNVPDDTERLSLIRFMKGAASNSATATTRLNVMGDIINSTPAVLEFGLKYDSSGVPTSDSIPDGRLRSFYESNKTLKNWRFRLIVVGTNQGVLHGFGEVSGIEYTTVTDENGVKSTTSKLHAQLDELWGIIPPDLLPGLNAWRNGTEHRYMVDGSPVAFINEQGTANGVIDGTDFVRLVFGLRKGGRSYYALTFEGNNPANPKVAWMLRPDDYTEEPMKSMGFSTSTPALARVGLTNEATLRDVLFIGGGLSTSDVDKAYGFTPPGKGLGRSVVAVNVYNGKVEKSWDFNADYFQPFALGCIPAGVVPVETIANTYKAQRVYFTDTSGGVYCLGVRSNDQWRYDSHNMGGWGLRRIFKSKFYPTSPLNDRVNVISTSPAVFPLPKGYPCAMTSPLLPSSVQTFGIAVGMGDRNDPMDRDEFDPGGGGNNATTTVNRFVVVLDRQDSVKIIADSAGLNEDNLADLTSISSSTDTPVSPASAPNYLQTKVGYYLRLDPGPLQVKNKSSDPNKWFYEKMVISPVVLDGILFFTTFKPTANVDPCVSKGGTSTTYRFNNVLAPVYGNGDIQISGNGDGWYFKYNDIPSELATMGLAAALQVGEEVVDTGATAGGTGTVKPIVMPGSNTSNMPRPRAWRIIR